MATKTNKIVDTVADAVVRAELAIVRTGRQAVQAVNRRVGGKRTAKKAVKKAVSKAKRAVRKAVKRATPKRATRARKARRR
jgi:fructose-specific phosphotransferase system component IIB